jgi:uncharacterized protein
VTESPFPPPEAIGLQFEWDPEKNKANVAKHDLGFENVRRAFSGPMLSRIDGRRDYGEERWIGLGRIEDAVVVVAYTMRSDKVRIISARKANRNEAKTYKQTFGPESSER